jgi:hypothetical protein
MVSAKKVQPVNWAWVVAAGLIAVGLLLLIGNSGWLPWTTILDIFQLWPLVLIVFGIDLLLKGHYRAMLIGTTLIAGLLLYLVQVNLAGTLLSKTEHITQELGAAQNASIEIKTGVNQLYLSSSNSSALIEGRVESGRGETIKQNFKLEGATAYYSLISEQQAPLGLKSQSGTRKWTLALNNKVALDLLISTGVGRAVLDFSAIKLSKVAIHQGVGSVDLSLPPTGRYEVSLNAGVGAMTLSIPSEMAARIEINRGVGAVTVRGDFDKRNDLYISPNYDSAENRVDLKVNGGIGNISISSVF